MGRLDRPANVVTVIPRVAVENKYGGVDLTPGEPIEVRCNVQPMTVEEVTAFGGIAVSEYYRCIARGPWPGGPHSEIVWNGKRFNQEGEARIYTQSRRTAHFDVAMRAVSAEVK